MLRDSRPSRFPAAYLSEHAGDVRAFDGDGLTDTAPDPGIRTTECGQGAELVLNGVRVPLARRNVMSYYDAALSNRNRKGLRPRGARSDDAWS